MKDQHFLKFLNKAIEPELFSLDQFGSITNFPPVGGYFI